MLIHLYDAGPVLKQDVGSQHADRGATMLTRLHAAGWCRVDFFKPADFLVIQGTAKSGGGGGGAFIRGGVRLSGILRYILRRNAYTI